MSTLCVTVSQILISLKYFKHVPRSENLAVSNASSESRVYAVEAPSWLKVILCVYNLKLSRNLDHRLRKDVYYYGFKHQ